MLTLYDFNKNKLDGRAQLTWGHSTYFAVRCNETHSVALYHMGEFFVEVWYDQDQNEITVVRGFRSKPLLEPYADMVELSEILD